jgi:hypothetical protein
MYRHVTDIFVIQYIAIIRHRAKTQIGRIAVTGQALMATLSLNWFRWRRVSNGYRLERPRPSEPERIFANGGREIPYYPFAHTDSLYTIFAQVRTPAGLLEFVERYGPLRSLGFEKAPRQPEDIPLELDFSTVTRGHKEDYFKFVDQAGLLAINCDLGGEEVEDDLREADWFRQCLSKVGNVKQMNSFLAEKYHTFTLNPVPSATAKPGFELRLVPRDFLDALRFQLLHEISGGADLRSCMQCGQWFKIGPRSRRRDAKFCCDEHRVLFNSAKRSKGD